MATLHPDFSEFLSCSKKFGVEFVVVGAHALATLGVQRWTADLDVLLEPSRDNAARLARVLSEFEWSQLAQAAPEHFSMPDRMARLGRPPVQIDLLTSVSGLTFAEARAGSVEATLGGVEVRVLGLQA